VYTDNTLAFEFVEGEIKLRQFNTFPKCIWDWTCQKRDLGKKLRRKCTRVRQEAGGSVRVLAIERTGQRPIPSAGAV
jgi:hypothetical protein